MEYTEIEAGLVGDDDSVTVRGDMEDGGEIYLAHNKPHDSLDTTEMSDGLASELGEWVPLDRSALADGTLPALQSELLSDRLAPLRFFPCLQVVDHSRCRSEVALRSA